MQMALMNNRKKENWRKAIEKKSDRAKAIIHRWVLLARYNLHPSILERELNAGREKGEDEGSEDPEDSAL